MTPTDTRFVMVSLGHQRRLPSWVHDPRSWFNLLYHLPYPLTPSKEVVKKVKKGVGGRSQKVEEGIHTGLAQTARKKVGCLISNALRRGQTSTWLDMSTGTHERSRSHATTSSGPRWLNLCQPSVSTLQPPHRSIFAIDLGSPHQDCTERLPSNWGRH